MAGRGKADSWKADVGGGTVEAGPWKRGLEGGQTNTSEWREILETNILGLSVCTREALKIMKAKEVADGHIIHIGRFSFKPRSEYSSYNFRSMYRASLHLQRTPDHLLNIHEIIINVIHDIIVKPVGEEF
ncbi:Farnesol dehydrogenase [Gryllus bimaculatus]|nr:Farnesol dehydrogenase [Gryllus bimaculatus]